MTDKNIQQVLTEDAVLAGVPEFLDIPKDMQDKIAEAVLAKERFFWLSNKLIPKNEWTVGLLRRAIYAEQRVVETEFMIGEMAIICEGAKKRVQQLEEQVKSLADATDKEANLIVRF